MNPDPIVAKWLDFANISSAECDALRAASPAEAKKRAAEILQRVSLAIEGSILRDVVNAPTEYPEGSFGWRRKHRRRAEREQRDDRWS